MDIDAAIARTRLEAIEAPARFDAVVVGAGAAGGLAAARLTEAGLRTLVLDAGWTPPLWQRPVTRSLNWAVRLLANPAALRVVPSRVAWKARQALKLAGRMRQPVQSRCYAWETLPNGFVDDLDNPYETPPDQPFNWVRARGLGGRMVVPAHGKQYLRHGAADFAPEDGLSPAWPLEPGELDPWYAEVERRLGLFGQRNGSAWVPDSEIAHELVADVAQAALMQRIEETWPTAETMLGRYAEPMASLAAAAATGRLHCRPGAVACGVRVSSTGNVKGVVFHDHAAGRRVEAHAPIVFLCASALETTRLLLLSREGAFLEQAGSEAGALGRYVMDHVSVKVEGTMARLAETDGSFNLGNCVYLPRFDRRDGGHRRQRGYGVRLYQTPGPPGRSYFTAVSDAEMLPRADNRVRLAERTDCWGIPVLHISCSHGPEERAMAEEQVKAVLEVADLFEADLTSRRAAPSIPGSAVHEVGGARMGADPETSVVDPHNQCWDAKGLYVTDGAAFPSIGIQNPTLTILALTARACDHAIQES